MRLPEITYTRNTAKISFPDITVWYSYNTPIAFETFDEFQIRKNDWSNTTGKHLNNINDDHSIRISGEEFETRLSETINKI